MRRSWQLGPVLRGIRGHRAAAILVTVQFGIGLAITVLAALIADYFTGSRHAPPVAIERDLAIVELQLPAHAPDLATRRGALLADLARMPGVAGATTIGGLPLHQLEKPLDEVRIVDNPRAAATSIAAFEGGANLLKVSGLQLRAGRDLDDRDVHRQANSSGNITSAEPDRGGVMPAIVSVALAETLWPGRDAVGRRFHSRGYGAAIVVGVVEDTRTYLFGAADLTAFFAVDRPTSRAVALVRSEPGRTGEVRAALLRRLSAPGQHAVVTPALEHLRHTASPVSSVLAILGIIVSSIVVVVLIGSMGLTYFLVASRTREIGLRRAMGATRKDVVRYFLLENVILTGAGTLVGLAIIAVVMPTMLYEQEDLDVRWWLVAFTIAAVVGLNLLATLIPARKAAAVPPVVASRT